MKTRILSLAAALICAAMSLSAINWKKYEDGFLSLEYPSGAKIDCKLVEENEYEISIDYNFDNNELGAFLIFMQINLIDVDYDELNKGLKDIVTMFQDRIKTGLQQPNTETKLGEEIIERNGENIKSVTVPFSVTSTNGGHIYGKGTMEAYSEKQIRVSMVLYTDDDMRQLCELTIAGINVKQ